MVSPWKLEPLSLSLESRSSGVICGPSQSIQNLGNKCMEGKKWKKKKGRKNESPRKALNSEVYSGTFR